MRLDDLWPGEGATKRRKRIGRGPGSGHGKTSGRGHKGDKSRGQSKVGFEGGQTPLHRRLPKRRGLPGQGIGHRHVKTEYSIVNLGELERFDAGTEITPEFLIANRVISSLRDGVKILGEGKLTRALSVRAHHFSKSAEEKITSLGGSAERI